MGLIASIQPGAIRDTEDFIMALEMVITDAFRYCGSPSGRNGDALEYLIDSINGIPPMSFRIAIEEWETYHKSVHGDERRLVDAWRESGLPVKEVLAAIEGVVFARDADREETDNDNDDDDDDDQAHETPTGIETPSGIVQLGAVSVATAD